MYADYDFYQNSYGGELITAEKWASMEMRAEIFIDRVTSSRLREYPPEGDAYWISIQFAVCQLAEAMQAVQAYKVQAQKTAMLNSVSTKGGRVTSVTSGSESITFADDEAGAAYALAAGSPAAEDGLYYGIVYPYLADIPDANGVNLLYAGL